MELDYHVIFFPRQSFSYFCVDYGVSANCSVCILHQLSPWKNVRKERHGWLISSNLYFTDIHALDGHNNQVQEICINHALSSSTGLVEILQMIILESTVGKQASSAKKKKKNSSTIIVGLISIKQLSMYHSTFLV